MQNSSHLTKRSDWIEKPQEPLHEMSYQRRFHSRRKILPTANKNHLEQPAAMAAGMSSGT